MNNRRQIAKKFANCINCDKIKQIILFGSVARGDDNPDSDIDILIVSNHEEDIKEIISNVSFDIIISYNEVISPHIISEDHLAEIYDFSFMRNVRRDGIIIG